MSYYQAGGFFGKIFKAVGKIFKPVVKPLLGAAVSIIPGAAAVSNALAQVDPTNPRGMVGALTHLGSPAMGANPAVAQIGRVSQLFSPAAAPAGLPMEGSLRGGFTYQQLAGPAARHPRRVARLRKRRRRRYYR